MPYELEYNIPKRKFFLDQDTMDEIASFCAEEVVAYYLRDKKLMDKKQFESVYEDFDPWAVLNFSVWLNGGSESDYQRNNESHSYL